MEAAGAGTGCGNIELPRYRASEVKCEEMNRRVTLLGSLFLALVIAVTVAVVRLGHAGSKVGASFVNSERAHSPFPSMVESDRLAFDVWNAGSKSAFLSILEIEDARGNWMRTNYVLGEVQLGQTNQYYLYVSPHSEPRSVKIRVSEKASVVYKTRFAGRLLWQRARGRYQGKQFWHNGLWQPVQEFVLKIGKDSDSNKGR